MVAKSYPLADGTCRTCRFWVAGSPGRVPLERTPNKVGCYDGDCRRHAPAPDWPRTTTNAGCGDYEEEIFVDVEAEA